MIWPYPRQLFILYRAPSYFVAFRTVHISNLVKTIVRHAIIAYPLRTRAFDLCGTKTLHDESRASRLELPITPNVGDALLMSPTLRGSWLGPATRGV